MHQQMAAGGDEPAVMLLRVRAIVLGKQILTPVMGGKRSNRTGTQIPITHPGRQHQLSVVPAREHRALRESSPRWLLLAPV